MLPLTQLVATVRAGRTAPEWSAASANVRRGARRATARTLAAGTIVTGTLAATPSAGAAPTVTRFPATPPPVGTCGGWSAPAPAPDGTMWMLDGASGKASRITPQGAVVALPQPGAVGCMVAAVAGPDGNMWGSSISGGEVVRYAPSGAATAFPTGESNSFDIAAGDDGNLWVRSFDSRSVGHVSTAGTYTNMSGDPLAGGPSSLAIGPDGNPWFGQQPLLGQPPFSGLSTFGVSGGGLLTFTGIPVPSSITAGPDGNLWYTQGAGQPVIRRGGPGFLTTTAFSDPAVTLGGGTSIVSGPDGNLWITDPDNARVVRLTPSGTFTAVPVGGPPNGRLGVGADGALWFAEVSGGSAAVGRIAPDPAPDYTDAAALDVPATGTTSGPASRYPATIDAAGHVGTVTSVAVRLNGVHHAYGADLTVQLVGPQGQSALLMANSTNRPGDLLTPRDVLSGEVVTIKEGSPTAPRRLTSGVFSQIDPADGAFLVDFPAPAPNSPTADLSVFNGTNPNGTWKLFVADDEGSSGTTGRIAGGWSLDIETTGVAPTPTPTATPVPTAAPTPAAPIPPPSLPLATDTLAPKLTLGKLPKSVSLATLRKGLAVRVTPSESATVQATLRAPAKGSTSTTRFPVQLARETRSPSAGAATRLLLKPTPARLGTPRRTFTVQLELVATDAAGNRAATTRKLTVTVPRRR